MRPQVSPGDLSDQRRERTLHLYPHPGKLWLSLSCIGVLTYNLVANNTSGKKLKTTELMPNFKDGKMEATQRGKITGLRPHSKPRSECYS